MKKLIGILTLFMLTFLLSGCSSNIEKINLKNLQKSIDNKETFILEVVQTGCSNCENFSPKFEKILKEYNIKAKSINTTDLSEEENNKFSSLFHITGTPTVIFITKGEEEYTYKRIVGDVSNDVIITKLKKAGYIKEK